MVKDRGRWEWDTQEMGFGHVKFDLPKRQVEMSSK